MLEVPVKRFLYWEIARVFISFWVDDRNSDGRQSLIDNHPSGFLSISCPKSDSHPLWRGETPTVGSPSITITHQNIQGTNAEWKQKYIEAACNHNKTQIITFTELNSTENLLKNIKHISRNNKLMPCSEKRTANGQRVIALVKYLLAWDIAKILSLHGRIFNIIIRKWIKNVFNYMQFRLL